MAETWHAPPQINPDLARKFYRTHTWVDFRCTHCDIHEGWIESNWPCPSDPDFPVEVYEAVHEVWPSWTYWPSNWSPPPPDDPD